MMAFLRNGLKVVASWLVAQSLGASGLSSSDSFCGSVDFRRATGSELETLVFLNNMDAGMSFTSQSCGLYGENIRLCGDCKDEVPESTMRILRPILGQKEHTDWHAKWHKIRSNHKSISDELFAKLQEAGLVPKGTQRIAFFGSYGLGGELAGENFFYMHRMMIKMIQFELGSRGVSCIAPWVKLPETIDDFLWPVPKDFNSLEQKAEDEVVLESLQKKLRKYSNTDFLSRISLNRLGEILEPELHRDLHEFYRGSPVNSEEAAAQGFKDDLGPVETSHLNKYFWKIHGLVDEILGNWLAANGFSRISTQCQALDHCYQWKATWVGKYPEL